MRKFLVTIMMLSLLMLAMGGTAFGAAMSSADIPGGASVAYFQAGAGFTTLINIQSISRTSSILVHVRIYDRNSNHILDFSIPFTALDNVGIAITGDGASSVTFSPYSDNAFGGSQMPVTVSLAANGTDGLQYGYITIAVTADGNGDYLNGLFGAGGVAAQAAGAARFGNPANFVNFRAPTLVATNQGQITVPYDNLIVRTAILSADGAIGFNNAMFQKFMNIPTLDETGVATVGTTVDTVAAGQALVACVSYNADADAADNFATTEDDANGIGIDPWELYITNVGPAVNVSGLVCDQGLGANIERALGSTRTTVNRTFVAGVVGDPGQPSTYWARYNEDPTGAETHTTLVVIFPANTLATAIESRASMRFISYNDDETGPSFLANPPEVGHLEFGSTVTPRPGNVSIVAGGLAGEATFTAGAPMFGYSFIEGPTFFDIYHITRATMGVNASDFNLASCRPNAANAGCNGFDNGAGFSDIVIIP